MLFMLLSTNEKQQQIKVYFFVCLFVVFQNIRSIVKCYTLYNGCIGWLYNIPKCLQSCKGLIHFSFFLVYNRRLCFIFSPYSFEKLL